MPLHFFLLLVVCSVLQVEAAAALPPSLVFGHGMATPAGIMAGATEPSLLFVPADSTFPNGTLLAVAGAHPTNASLGNALVLRTSHDRGASWGPIQMPFLPFSDPAVVGSFFQNMLTYNERTGSVFLTIGNITRRTNTCGNGAGNLESEDGLLQIASEDRGATWSTPPLNVQAQLQDSPTRCLAPTTGAGVYMNNSATPVRFRGRQLMTGVHNAYHGDVIVFSDDNGMTYRASTSLYIPGIESHGDSRI